MKDFGYVLIMLLLVMGGFLAFMFLAQLIGFWGLAIFEFVITVGIILLAIRFIRSHRPPGNP